jgi:hypothetical protein
MRHTVLLLLSAFLLLTAVRGEEASSVIEGRLQPAGPSIYMEGSYELVNSKGELLARLSGLRYKVDLSPYENRWVTLTGEWRPTVESGGKIFEVRSLEPSKAAPINV